MQEIADNCDINKALLHYHYQNKKALFHEVLVETFRQFLPRIMDILNSDLELEEKLVAASGKYMELIGANPRVPMFVLNEMQSNPDFAGQLASGVGVAPFGFVEQVQGAVEAGELDPIDPFQIIADMIGLCLISFLARPMIQTVSRKSDKEYEAFLAERKKHVADLLVTGLLKKNITSRKRS